MRWFERAITHYGRPVVFYSGTFILVGLAFVLGSFYLDPDLRHIGSILMLVGVGMFVVFLVMAYYSYCIERRRGGC
jgi:hypothetical protein